MEFDVAVLGGGPAGYTAAIRAAQLGARVACVEREAELGGTCLRVGCIPTKAWVSTAHALHAAREVNPKLGVVGGEPELDFAQANEWKAQVSKQMTGGVASLFKANNVTWFQGSARFEDARSFAFDKGEIGLSFKSAIIATGSQPIMPPIPGLESPRCVDSTGLLAQTEVPRRLVVLGGGIIGCEFASIFERFGTEVTMIEMLETLIPQEDSDATSELRKSFARRGIVVHLGKQCTKVEDTGAGLVVHFGEGETVECDLMLVSVGRAPLVEGIGLEAAGVTFDPKQAWEPTTIGGRPLRTSTRRVTSPATGSSLTPLSVRAKSRRRTRPVTKPRSPMTRGAAADLHGSGNRRRRTHRGAGSRAVRRRERRHRTVSVGRERARGHVRERPQAGSRRSTSRATASSSASSSSAHTRPTSSRRPLSRSTLSRRSRRSPTAWPRIRRSVRA